MFFSPGKWMPISPLNLHWLTDPHDLQGIPASPGVAQQTLGEVVFPICRELTLLVEVPGKGGKSSTNNPLRMAFFRQCLVSRITVQVESVIVHLSGFRVNQN
jgi:hypothetical protein